MKSYIYLYKITNSKNNKIYIGIHKTNNLNDGYLGSGSAIKAAVKKYGTQYFLKEILQYFDSWEEALVAERNYVNEDFINRKDTYNIKLGGDGWGTVGLVPVKDEFGNCFLLSIKDDEYINGTYNHVVKGHTTVITENGNFLSVKKDDPRFLTGEISHPVVVKDDIGNIYAVHKLNPLYIAGKLTHIWFGKQHTKQTKEKMSEIKRGKYKGKENSQFETCWIHNINHKENKKIKKDELQKYLDNGWTKGRKINWN